MVRRTTELTVTGKFSGKLKMCFLRVEAPFIQILHMVARFKNEQSSNYSRQLNKRRGL